MAEPVPTDAILAAVEHLLGPALVAQAERDADGTLTGLRVRYANAAARAAGDPTPAGRRLEEVLDDGARRAAQAAAVLAGGEPATFGLNGRIQRLGDGVLVTWSTAERERELLFLAFHDPLTGLRNRRGLEDEIRRELDRGARYGTSAVLLAADIDGFKAVNDTGGHAAGDAALVAVAGALADRLRRTDLLVRTGGDEFAAVLPGTGRDDGARAAELLRAAVAHTGVTISIGLTALDPAVHADPAAALAAADAALYAAKAAGRDRVVAR